MKTKPGGGGKEKKENALKDKIKTSMCGMCRKVNQSFFHGGGKGIKKERKQIRIKAEAAGESERWLDAELRPSSRASRRPAGYTHAHASPPAAAVIALASAALALSGSQHHG